MDPTHPAFDFCDGARRTDGAVFVNHLWTAAIVACRGTGFVAVAADVEYDDLLGAAAIRNTSGVRRRCWPCGQNVLRRR
jgi:hypothetical protein